MKRLFCVLMAIVMLVLTGCGSFKVYDINEIVPPLIDVTTQYPYTEKITVTNCTTGETQEFTEGSDHDLIRMQFEGIEAVREKVKNTQEFTPLFVITFHTTEGKTDIQLLDNSYRFIIDGYLYDALRAKIDIVFFENLFLK